MAEGERDPKVDECDRQIEEYRKTLGLVSSRGRQAVWDQIDSLLERRHRLTNGRREKTGEAP